MRIQQVIHAKLSEQCLAYREMLHQLVLWKGLIWSCCGEDSADMDHIVIINKEAFVSLNYMKDI